MILITGSKGFVGKNLTERFQGRYDFEVFNRNDCLDLTGVDTVIHLASDANSRESNSHLIRSVQDNIGVFTRVLEEAVKNKVRRFIYVSSIEAEGEHNVYAVSKATCEKILKIVSKTYNMEYVILRPCNLYGPYMDLQDTGRNVIGNFMRSLKEKTKMNIIGTGDNSYPFTYVKRLIDAIELSLNIYTNQTITVGSTLYISINQLPEILEGITTTWDWVKNV